MNNINDTEVKLTGEIVSEMKDLTARELEQTLTFIRGINVGRSIAGSERVS